MKMNYKNNLGVLILLIFSIISFGQSPSNDSLNNTKSAIVTIYEEELFEIKTAEPGFSIDEKAKLFTKKIENISLNTFNPDSFQVIYENGNYELFYNTKSIFAITGKEASAHGKPGNNLIENFKSELTNTLKEKGKSGTITDTLIRIGLIILILIGAFFIVKLINSLFKKLDSKLIPLKEKYLTGLKVKNYEILHQERLILAFDFAFKIARYLVVGIVLYLALPLLFSVFPWTKGLAGTLFGWIWSPVKKILGGFLGYIPNMLTIAVIYYVTRYCVRFFQFLANEIKTKKLKINGFYPDWAIPTFNIIKIILYAFMFVVIFPYLPGSDSPIFQGVSVFIGVLFSLGSSSAISNMVAGLVITYMRPFKIGDRIKVGEITGDVVEKTMLVTRVRTVKNEDITIPNGSILAGHTVNYTSSSKKRGLILHTTVTIGYDVPWQKVQNALIDAALASEGVDIKKQPFVLQTSLDDFYVSYQLNCYTNQPEKMSKIYSNIHQNIQDKFNETDIEILSPHYRAMRDGNMITIPADYLPSDYQAPSFNVNVNKQQ